MVLITYDIAISQNNGANRLRKVAKLCQNYGTRVQNSVFECIIDNQTFIKLKKQILDELDLAMDSVRFYQLGNSFSNRVEHFGVKETWDLTGTLII